MQATATTLDHEQEYTPINSRNKVLVASLIGTAIEFFDFYICSAGAKREDHDERKEQSNKLLHVHAIFSSIKILPDIRVVFCCVFTTVFSIPRAGIASNPICFENIKKI